MNTFTFAELPEPLQLAVASRCDALGNNWGVCMKLDSHEAAKQWSGQFDTLIATLTLTPLEKTRLIKEFNLAAKPHWNPSR